MLKIKKTNKKTGKMLHTWLNVKDVRTVLNIILKDCFNGEGYACSDSDGNIHWENERGILWNDEDAMKTFEYWEDWSSANSVVYDVDLV